MERSVMVPFKQLKFKQINGTVAGFQDGTLVGRRSQLKSTKHKKVNPNRVRDEVQYELVYLRDKVKELETKLRSLRLNASEERAVGLPTDSPFVWTPRVWEDIATRQKSRCDLAQHENARLKVLVERKQKMTTSLCEILQKRLHQQVTSSPAKNLTLTEGAAAWNHFKGIEKHLDNGGLYGKSMKNLEQPFTILEDFTKELFSKNLRADVQAKQIVRRCVEPDRDMILFVSSMTPTEIKHKAVNGLIFHAQEYALTKCIPDPTCGRELSLLQLCTRISIECTPDISIDARYIRSAIRFWIDNVTDNIKCYQVGIENALIDQVLRGRSQ
ncbi:M96 mating-specific protein family [Phytophthora palmivora]|uniref:M96 mating-specific protein family n=1 Tax=Phytophthora palmivora TaxID=4796 RepID=A0A2P4YQD1_9STRA|nr:M96 mating-specific protein family [Phytophthora palmivora]